MKKDLSIKQIKQRHGVCRKLIIAHAISALISVGVAFGSLLAGAGCNVKHDNLKTNINNDLEYLYSSQGYVEYLTSKTDDIYTQLKNGEISIGKFNEEYQNSKSDEMLIEYAKTVQDEQVQQIISNYEKQLTELEEKKTKTLNATLYSMGATVGLFVSMSVIDEKMKGYKQKYNNALNLESEK